MVSLPPVPARTQSAQHTLGEDWTQRPLPFPSPAPTQAASTTAVTLAAVSEEETCGHPSNCPHRTTFCKKYPRTQTGTWALKPPVMVRPSVLPNSQEVLKNKVLFPLACSPIRLDGKWSIQNMRHVHLVIGSLGFPGHFRDTWFFLGCIVSSGNLLSQKVFPELNTVVESAFLVIDAIIHLKKLAY